MQATTNPTIESSQASRGAATDRPARFSHWRWLIAAMNRRIAKGQASRLEKVERVLRPGRIGPRT
jgi:hypothetical protein